MARRVPIHQRLNAHCIAAGLTAEDLAKRTGWSHMRTWRILTGRTRVMADDVEAIAKALNEPVASFYEGAAK